MKISLLVVVISCLIATMGAINSASLESSPADKSRHDAPSRTNDGITNGIARTYSPFTTRHDNL